MNKLPEKLRNLLTEAAMEAEKKTLVLFDNLVKQERPFSLKKASR